MPDYLVTWAIDAEDMDTPREAAEFALYIQGIPDGTARYFTVKDKATGQTVDVDLCDEGEDA